MKKFKLKVKEVNTGEYIILANSAEEAEAKFIAINNTTDMVNFHDSDMDITVVEMTPTPSFDDLCIGECEVCNDEKRACCRAVEAKGGGLVDGVS